MARFKVKKVLTAYWFNVEAENASQAAFKTRRVIPDRQMVYESHIIMKRRKKQKEGAPNATEA